MPRMDVELKRDKYRQVFTGPLASPLQLWLGMIFWVAATVFSVWVVHASGSFWWAFAPALTAIPIGIALAGLEPGYWFRKPPPEEVDE